MIPLHHYWNSQIVRESEEMEWYGKNYNHINCLFYLFLQNVDKWSFDVFALNDASGDHALKFIFYELLTRYDLINRFKVSS